jgi:hypothetical protein
LGLLLSGGVRYLPLSLFNSLIKVVFMMYGQLRRPETLELHLPLKVARDYKVSRNQARDEILKVIKPENAKAIKCIQSSPNGKSFFITFRTGNDGLRNHLLNQGVYFKGLFVSFLETESCQKTVYVTNLPCEMSAEEVVHSYSPFGTVTRITAVTDELGIETGERLLVMTLIEHIPHCLKIQGFFVFNRYRGQPPSCFLCNGWGHTMSVCPFKERNVCCRCGNDDHRSNRCPQPWALPPRKPVGFAGPLQPSLIDLEVEHGPPPVQGETENATAPLIHIETASTAEHMVETVNTVALIDTEPTEKTTETAEPTPSEGSWADEESNFTASLNGDEISMDLSGDGVQLTPDLPGALPQSTSSPKLISYVPSPIETSTVQQSPSSHQQLLIAYSHRLGIPSTIYSPQ